MKNLIDFSIRHPGIILLSAIFMIFNNCSKPYPEHIYKQVSTPVLFRHQVLVGRDTYDHDLIFNPEKMAIVVNDTVLWKNISESETFRIICDSAHFIGTISPGQSYWYVFRKPGTYEYTNNIFGNKGYVTVN